MIIKGERTLPAIKLRQESWQNTYNPGFRTQGNLDVSVTLVFIEVNVCNLECIIYSDRTSLSIFRGVFVTSWQKIVPQRH
jgi:hypothetical protein